MKKFQLSSQYRLLTPDDIADSDKPVATQLKQGALHGLFDTASSECILINQAMYVFLKAYETPKTLEEVTATLAEAFNSHPKEVLPIAQQFFKEMREREILLSGKAAESTEIIHAYPIGTLIDHYRIEKKLSANLPIEVYKAQDTVTQAIVILKMLRLPASLSEKNRKKWRKTFKKEFTIQKILRGHTKTIERGHSHICDLLSLTPDYAVLEWIEGISLRNRLEEGKPLNTVLRESLLLQLLDTYAFMHRKKVLHSDVHTSNILLTNENQIKIIDFDLANQLTKKGKRPELLGGAPEFIPPENIRFDAFSIVQGTTNYRTEVYQLGLIAYWMTYGKMPFAGDTWQELATHILNSDIDFAPLSNGGETIDPLMIAFLQKSLSRKPKHRFSSAKTMNKAFRGMALKG